MKFFIASILFLSASMALARDRQYVPYNLLDHDTADYLQSVGALVCDCNCLAPSTELASNCHAGILPCDSNVRFW